ncbi:MAG TPA: signal peptidase I [Kiritimatiellia bacterium]|nr:signal peptidase I [Kiritimatiellia bacterium]HMO98026.1 signal peptidase I [Kiritimatiellia bacterium]HMP96551.1 signal peptidase I [Kiritimatiellia bacterium]
MTRLKTLIWGRNPKKTLLRCLLLGLVAAWVFGWWLRPVRVVGISMEPTMHHGGVHLIDLRKFRSREPGRGDLVAIAMPGRRSFYLKRVLGLPGETIAFRQGRLVINDRELPEPYLYELGDWELEDTPIPTGVYFVAGDNRATPFSGHTLGLVERSNIAGGLFR